MSLKCSVFGHRFGNPEVEREREEQGSEVVITITETETCERCGETRVVSENKEVTTLETPSDIVGDDLDDAGDGAVSDDAGADDVSESTEAAPTAGDPTEPAGKAAETSEGPQPQPESTTPDQPIEQAPGQSADEPGRGGAPEPDAVDAGDDDAVILDEEETEETEVGERAPGEWPQEETEDEPDEDLIPTGDEDELRPVEDEQPEVEPTGSAVTVPDGEFHCPECGFTTAVESSSLREGDFCPECHRGSLEHRAEE